MKKILVIGSSGSGKSTFARKLGELLNIKVIHLDSHFWHPGWIETPKDEWNGVVERLLERGTWIMDGNYSGTLEKRILACDTIFFLDLPRRICLARVLKRRIAYFNRSRPDLAEGCPERLDWEFLKWVWGYPKRTRPGTIGLLEKFSGSKTVIWMRSQSEIDRFLKNV
jgi:adenylate kinase family enzyme